MPLKPPVTMPTSDRDFQAWARSSHDMRVLSGSGAPEGVVTADRGTIYMRTDGAASTTLYIKTSGDGLKTGWSAVTP